MIVFVILLNLQNHSIYSPPIVFVLVGHSFLTLLAMLPEAAEPEGQRGYVAEDEVAQFPSIFQLFKFFFSKESDM